VFDHALGCRDAGGAEQLIRRGGAYEVDISGDVYLGDDLFRLRLNAVVVTPTSTAEAERRLVAALEDEALARVLQQAEAIANERSLTWPEARERIKGGCPLLETGVPP